MTVKDKSKGKQVGSIKGNSPPPTTIEINPGNVSILTVKLLDTLVREVQGLRQDLKESRNG